MPSARERFGVFVRDAALRALDEDVLPRLGYCLTRLRPPPAIRFRMRDRLSRRLRRLQRAARRVVLTGAA